MAAPSDARTQGPLLRSRHDRNRKHGLEPHAAGEAIVCGLALWVEFTFQPPLWVHAVLWLPLICLLTAIFLRLSKSALLVLQYKHKAGEGRLT